MVSNRESKAMKGTYRSIFAAGAIAAGLVAGAAQAETIIRMVPHASLQILDPVWTTGYITRNHGYLVYDTLFSLNAKLEPTPQMVESWTISEDKLLYSFTLRPGLKFHDGSP